MRVRIESDMRETRKWPRTRLEAPSFLASAGRLRARALRSQSGAVMSCKNGTTVSRGFRRSYGVIWPGRCPVQNYLDVYKFRGKVLTLYTATAPRKYLNLWQDNLRLSFSITAGLRFVSWKKWASVTAFRPWDVIAPRTRKCFKFKLCC